MADLRLSLLKLTCLANYGRGPYRSGRWGWETAEAAKFFVASVDEDSLPEYRDGISFDHREAVDYVTSDIWLHARGIGSRIFEAACF